MKTLIIVIGLLTSCLTMSAHAFTIDKDSFYLEQKDHASRLLIENLEKIKLSKDSTIPDSMAKTIEKFGFATAFQWEILGTGAGPYVPLTPSIGKTSKFMSHCFENSEKSDFESGILFQNCTFGVLSYYTSGDNQTKSNGGYIFKFENKVDLNKGVSEITNNEVTLIFNNK